MAVSVENISRGDRSWRWKSLLRVITLVMALLAISCVAWLTDYLRQWQRKNPEYVHRRYQTDIFILPGLLFTVCRFPRFLSVLYHATPGISFRRLRNLIMAI